MLVVNFSHRSTRPDGGSVTDDCLYGRWKKQMVHFTRWAEENLKHSCSCMHLFFRPPLSCLEGNVSRCVARHCPPPPGDNIVPFLCCSPPALLAFLLNTPSPSPRSKRVRKPTHNITVSHTTPVTHDTASHAQHRESRTTPRVTHNIEAFSR